MPLPDRRRFITSSFRSLDANNDSRWHGLPRDSRTMSPVSTFLASSSSIISVTIFLRFSPRTCFIPKILIFMFLLCCSFATRWRFTRSSFVSSSVTLQAFCSATCRTSTSCLRSCMLSEFNSFNVFSMFSQCFEQH